MADTAPRTLTFMPLDELASALVNPKTHDEPLINASINRFGLLDIPVIDERTGRLIGGHGRRDQLIEMRAEGKEPPEGVMLADDGGWLVPSLRGWASKDDDEAHAAGLALNRGAERGGWDEGGLLALLDGLGSENLVGVGFDPADLDNLVMETSYGPTVLARVTVPIESLTPHPRNYRGHPEDQIEHLAASLQQHGYLRNIVVARDDTILIGHGIVEAAKRIGRESAPITRLDLDPDSPQALKILVVDEIQRFADVDDRALTELLREVNEQDPTGLFGTGYDEMILANLLMVTRPMSEIETMDAAAEWVGLPDYEAEVIPWKLVVSFDSAEDRREFLDLYKITEEIAYTHSVRKTISARWPIPDGPKHDGGLRWEVAPE